ncbi:MAG: hypothetical protein EOP45_17855 [Sphingobacteriaceae bacterium]|nr:MAG: hypothetical protein EOP45_17855 [Sphingobacteriaceae bacterium]
MVCRKAPLEHFYSQVKALFPAKFWHLLGQDLQTKLDAKQQPQLTAPSPILTAEFASNQLYDV